MNSTSRDQAGRSERSPCHFRCLPVARLAGYKGKSRTTLNNNNRFCAICCKIKRMNRNSYQSPNISPLLPNISPLLAHAQLVANCIISMTRWQNDRKVLLARFMCRRNSMCLASDKLLPVLMEIDSSIIWYYVTIPVVLRYSSFS